MTIEHCAPMHQVDVEVSDSEDFDLLVALQEISGDHQSQNRGTIDTVCVQFHGNPSISC